MGTNTKIEWATHTLNPWRGCSKVSDGCANCYAEAGSKRNPAVLGTWGPKGSRVYASESKWNEPRAWDRAAVLAGERHRVFCASLADVFEDWDRPLVDAQRRPLDLTMDKARRRLARLIWETQNLDYLLVTKRPENANRMIYEMWAPDGEWPRNYWVGVSVEDRKHGLPRIEILRKLAVPLRFLSVEPLLEDLGPINLEGIHWVIVGGESGPHARPFDLQWARSIRDQCRSAGVSCFIKQLGFRPYDSGAEALGRIPGATLKRSYEEATSPEGLACLGACLDAMTVRLRDPHGGDWSEWPEDLKVRQFPEPIPGAA